MNGLTISGGDIAAILISIIGWAMSWGSLRQRVKTLEVEMAKVVEDMGRIQSMAERLVKVETMIATQSEYLRDLASSIRWMREPARYPNDPEEGGNGNRR